MAKKVYLDEEKNIYWKSREEACLTREEASEGMEFVSTDRIERIEYQKSLPHPDEVLAMADCYNKPILCNYYCSHDCPIGQEYVPMVEERSLSEITLGMLHSLNALIAERDRFIQIAYDGIISEDEQQDFERIQKELDQLSLIIDSLNLWALNIELKK